MILLVCHNSTYFYQTPRKVSPSSLFLLWLLQTGPIQERLEGHFGGIYLKYLKARSYIRYFNLSSNIGPSRFIVIQVYGLLKLILPRFDYSSCHTYMIIPGLYTTPSPSMLSHAFDI